MNGHKYTNQFDTQQSLDELQKAIRAGVVTHPDISDSCRDALIEIANMLRAASHGMIFTYTIYDRDNTARKLETLIDDISDAALSSDGWEVPNIGIYWRSEE